MQDMLIKFALGISALLATAGAAADDFSLDWWTVDAGGAMWTTGGDFELSGTIGQPDACVALTGGDFELVGGFWAGQQRFVYGDFNGDCHVGLSDLAELLGHYGTTAGATYWDGDIEPLPNGDGDVDLADLAEFLGRYGDTCP